MKRGIIGLAGFWAACFAAFPAQAQAPETSSSPAERLLFTLPPGWEPLHSTDTGTFQQTFFVPQTQNAGAWSDMIVVSMVRGAERSDMRTTHAKTAREYEDNCLSHTVASPQTSVQDGVGRAFWTLGCSRRKDTDTGEVSFFLFLQGADSNYLVQRIWRTASFEEREPPIALSERDAAVDFLKTVRLEQ